MQILTYNRTHNLDQLHDELIATVPSCRPIPQPDGTHDAVMCVEGRDDGLLRITVPDDVAAIDVKRVVDAHTPDPGYGDDRRITEADLLSMNDQALRRWLARLLLVSD